MEVRFDPTIQSYFNSSRALQKRFGSLSKKLILVVENLMKTRRADMMQIPGHPHYLRKYRNREIFSITVKHPFRCIFKVEPSGEFVTILNVVDYHNHEHRIL